MNHRSEHYLFIESFIFTYCEAAFAFLPIWHMITATDISKIAHISVETKHLIS